MNQNQPNTLLPEYFDQVYQANRDPWNFETSPYEREEIRHDAGRAAPGRTTLRPLK